MIYYAFFDVTYSILLVSSTKSMGRTFCNSKLMPHDREDWWVITHRWVLHLDSTSAVGDIYVFHARCNTFENMLCNKW